jgi:hypothetical protein
MKDQSLTDIVNALPVGFVSKVNELTDVPELLRMRSGADVKRKALIDARIERINWLACGG